MPTRKPRNKPGPSPAAANFDSLNQRQLSQLHGVSVRSITNWTAAGHPRNRDGSYSASDSIAWRVAREVHGGLSLTGERARLAKVQRELGELKLAVEREDLAPLSLIEQEFGALLAEIRTNALAIPTKIAPELEGQDCAERQATLEKAIFELLDRAAGWSPGQPA